MLPVFRLLGLRVIFILGSLSLLGCAWSSSLVEPVFRQDLREYSLEIKASNLQIVSYNEIAFLTDDLVVVAVNQRTIRKPIELSNVDEPPASLLFFNITKKALIRSARMLVEKDSNSLQPLSGARFAVRNESGIQICSMDFSCSQPITISGQGPLVASPRGTSFVAGGYGRTEQVLFDSLTEKELARFPWENPVVVPGDGVSLLRYDNRPQLFTKEAGKPKRAVQSNGDVGIFLPNSRFISDSVVAINESVETLLVARLDGVFMYRVPVHSWYKATSVISSASGRRFAIRESDFTPWNSITHFYDVEETRPYDLEKIRVLEVESGKTLFDIERDPRPYINRLTLPALSPDGHHVATIYRGFLEVYEIP